MDTIPAGIAAAPGCSESLNSLRSREIASTSIDHASEPPVPSTFVSLNYHVVFSTKDRIPMIADSWATRLHEYLGGTVKGLGGVSL